MTGFMLVAWSVETVDGGGGLKCCWIHCIKLLVASPLKRWHSPIPNEESVEAGWP